MTIKNIIFNFGKATLNRFGFMTERQMLAATTRAGRYARDISAAGKKLTDDTAVLILKKSLPKGIKIPDLVTTIKDKAADFVIASGMFSRKTVHDIWNMSGGFSYLNPMTAKSLITFNPFYCNSNIVAHEFRHHLDQIIPIKMKFANIFDKLMCKFKFYRNQKRNFLNDFQEKYVKLEKIILSKIGCLDPSSTKALNYKPTEAGLLAKLGVSKKRLTAFLSAKINNLFIDGNRKQNIKILKRLIFAMQTEKNAQSAGAKITRSIAHIKANESCYSDISSLFHDEMIPILKKELKKQRKNYYKSLLGFKVPKGKIKQAELKTKNPVERMIETMNNTAKPKKVSRFDEKTGKIVEYI